MDYVKQMLAKETLNFLYVNVSGFTDDFLKELDTTFEAAIVAVTATGNKKRTVHIRRLQDAQAIVRGEMVVRSFQEPWPSPI